MGNGRAVDVVVIGAGTAGLAAYRAAVAAGKTAVIIEGGAYGTTCARVGCMPSKLLIAAGDVAHDAREAAPFGVQATVEIDGVAVMARVKRERDRFVGFVLDTIEGIPDADRVRGHARFVSPTELDVDGLIITARSVVIATGSSSFLPPALERVRERVVFNDDVFSWDTLPKSVVVFGAGAIGLELGQALHRLGVRVHVFGHKGAIGPLSDSVVKAAAIAAFSTEFPIDPDCRDVVVSLESTGIAVQYRTELGAALVEGFEVALVAAGRRPNVAGLDLEKARVDLQPSGVPVFDRSTLQCGTGSIFIAGDVNDDVPLLHEAADEGRIAGENAARFPMVVPHLRRSTLGIVFTDPQLAVVGSSARSLEGRPNVVVGEVSFADQGRSRVIRKNVGVLRVFADAQSGAFLGAEMAGPRAEHIAHLLAWAHQQGLTIACMLQMPFYHPVVEEGLRTALRDAQHKIEFSSATPNAGRRPDIAAIG